MLSTLPKLADKNFVVGFLLPALLAFFAAALAFPDVAALAPLNSVAASDKQLFDVAYLALGVWLIAILLTTINHTQFRLLEGYLPPVSWFVPLRSRHKRRFRALLSQHDEMMAEWNETLRQGRQFPQTKQDDAARLRMKLLLHYPSTEAEVMPTSFGNTIRAFEVYPRQVYGADAIPVWMRLASVVPKDYAEQINDARAQVDCFVNVTYLAFTLLLASVWRVVLSVAQSPVGWATAHAGTELAVPSEIKRWLLAAAACFAVSLISYSWAVARATAWGEIVKSTFDCYLPALIKQLGYAVPSTEAERREFWEQFSAKALYNFPMRSEWPIAEKVDDKGGLGKPFEAMKGEAAEGDDRPERDWGNRDEPLPAQPQDADNHTTG